MGKLNLIIQPFVLNWPTIFRAALYFAIAVLLPIVVSLKDCLDRRATPSWLYAAWVFASALYQGLIVLRAFYDGSAQRNADRISAMKQEQRILGASQLTVAKPAGESKSN